MPVSIIVPSFNERGIISETIKDYYYNIIAKIPASELIVIDSSTDGTTDILKDMAKTMPFLKVEYMPKCGHGKAVRKGYELAQCDYVFQVDSDNQFNSSDFWKLYELKDKFDFITGIRENRNDPLPRLILTRIIRYAIFFVFGVWIKDSNCPFRLIKRQKLMELLDCVDKEAIAPNIILSILARKRGVKTVEVSVTHLRRQTGMASIKHWDVIKASYGGFIQLVKLKFQS